jgi:SAM-dependent methyltransferase
VTTANASAGKTSFDHVYNRNDPRPYYTELKPLEYAMPEVAQPIFERCADTISGLRRSDGVVMIDLCCGYGANTALLRHEVTMEELYGRYTCDETAALDSESLATLDRDFFADRERETAITEVVGIDAAENAVAYAEEVGLIDHGIVAKLDREMPDDGVARRAGEADLITVTGGMGYLDGAAFNHLLERFRDGRRPWIAAFPLVTASLDEFCAVFDAFGLETEIWEAETYPQRRFASPEERRRTMARIRELDRDFPLPEADEFQQAAFLLARPRDEIARFPIETIAAASGAPALG